MNKYSRYLVVIAAVSTLTLGGAGVATAQTSLPNLSSWLPGNPGPATPNPYAAAERSLYDAADRYGQKVTGKPSPTLNDTAKNLNTAGTYEPVGSGVEWRSFISDGGRNQIRRASTGNHQAIVSDLNNGNTSQLRDKAYGIHVSTSGGYHYVVLVFR